MLTASRLPCLSHRLAQTLVDRHTRQIRGWHGLTPLPHEKGFQATALEDCHARQPYRLAQIPSLASSPDARGPSHETDSRLARTHPFASRKGIPSHRARGLSRETTLPAGADSLPCIKPRCSRIARKTTLQLALLAARIARGWTRKTNTSADAAPQTLAYSAGQREHEEAAVPVRHGFAPHTL